MRSGMGLKMPTNTPSEHAEQCHVIQWAVLESRRNPKLNLLFAIPNGGRRSIGVAKKMKAEGVKAGIPDLFLPITSAFYNGLFIEMKKKTGGTLSKEQKQWISLLSRENYRVQVCKGADEAIKVIKNYLSIK